jgi:hypothetical protein
MVCEDETRLASVALKLGRGGERVLCAGKLRDDYGLLLLALIILAGVVVITWMILDAPPATADSFQGRALGQR